MHEYGKLFTRVVFREEGLTEEEEGEKTSIDASWPFQQTLSMLVLSCKQVIEPLIDPVSRTKIHFVDKNNALRKLEVEFDIEKVRPCSWTLLAAAWN